MAGFKFDHEKEGLSKTLKEYEEVTLRYVWSIGEEGVGSGKTWLAVNEVLGPDKSMSRTSVIFFLNRMVAQGVLTFRTRTLVRARIYYTLLDEKAYKKHLLKTIVKSLMRDFPEETREALGELSSYSE